VPPADAALLAENDAFGVDAETVRVLAGDGAGWLPPAPPAAWLCIVLATPAEGGFCGACPAREG